MPAALMAPTAGEVLRKSSSALAAPVDLTSLLEALVTVTIEASIRDGDLSLEGGLAHLGFREGRAFLEPGARRRRAPQRLATRIGQRPAQRLVIMIHGEIVAGVELEAVAVGIADIEEERVRDAVTAGTALQVLQVAAGCHHVAEMQHVHRGRHPVENGRASCRER